MMENKFTPRAEEALRLAQEAAEDMGHGYVGSEHLLLGLLREEEGIAHRVLEENGLTDEMVCDILHRSVGTGVSGAAPSQGLTPRAKSAVELAVSEAARTGAGYIGTEHLLMGLLREGNNMALRILRRARTRGRRHKPELARSTGHGKGAWEGGVDEASSAIYNPLTQLLSTILPGETAGRTGGGLWGFRFLALRSRSTSRKAHPSAN